MQDEANNQFSQFFAKAPNKLLKLSESSYFIFPTGTSISYGTLYTMYDMKRCSHVNKYTQLIHSIIQVQC